MKSRKLATVVFASMIGAFCLSVGPLDAWQRTAVNKCKKEAKICAKPKDCCKAAEEQCKKDAPAKDEYTFAYHLSPYSKSLFQNFTPDQRKRALDYADGNRMDPDDAVIKVDRGT